MPPFRIADSRVHAELVPVLARMPAIEGRRVDVRFQHALSAHRGKLLSNSEKGSAVHAGSDMRKRVMTLDSDLVADRQELERIFVHELHHFIWARLGNTRRWSYEELIAAQIGARGELGWSAERTKQDLLAADRDERSRRWREYVCESFCDTGAWIYSRRRSHPEWTLAARWRAARRRWFEECAPPVLYI